MNSMNLLETMFLGQYEYDSVMPVSTTGMNWYTGGLVNHHPVIIFMYDTYFLTSDWELVSVDSVGYKVIILYNIVNSCLLIINLNNNEIKG